MHARCCEVSVFFLSPLLPTRSINGQVLTLVMIASFSSPFLVTRVRLAMLRYKDECDISVFQVKFKVEFTSQVVNFP